MSMASTWWDTAWVAQSPPLPRPENPGQCAASCRLKPCSIRTHPIRRTCQPGQARSYPTEAEALARFRLLPAQKTCLPYVFDQIARNSVIRSADGWTWKYDRTLVNGLRGKLPKTTDIAAQARCPMAVIHCQHGEVTAADAATIAAVAPLPAPMVELTDAGHHPMVDQPLALLTAIRVLVASWSLTATLNAPIARRKSRSILQLVPRSLVTSRTFSIELDDDL